MTMMRDSLTNPTSLSTYTKREPIRLSGDEIRSLRKAGAAAQREQHRRRFILALSKLINDIVGQILISSTVKNANPMCTNYGHVIDNPHWTGSFPICRDCGESVRDSNQLRKAKLKGMDDLFVPHAR